MEREELITRVAEFLREFYYNDLIDAASEGKKSITVDFSLLDRFDTDLADYLLEYPDETLPAAEESTRQIDLPAEAKIKLRFVNLPETKNIRIRSIRAEHVGKLIAVDGIVKRASDVRPEVSEAIFQCTECGMKHTVIQTEIFMRAPIECDCGNRKNFKLIEQRLYDARWIVIEEPFEITTGERPSDIRIFLKEDLTTPKMQNKTEPGSRIKVVGVLKQLPRRIKGTPSRQMEIYIDANSVESVEVEWEELEIMPEDEKKIIELAHDPEIYQKLIHSIAPALYGMDSIKEGIALQLFGGETHIQRDKSRVRGDIHILLVGDPSCLVADERVVLGDGTIMKIGEMGSRHLEKINYNVHLGMGGKIGKALVFHAYRKQPIIEIITETGKSIKGTYNQPVLIVKNGQQLWKRLDEVEMGDKVQVVPKINCRKKSLVETEWKDYPYFHKSWHIKIPKFVDEKLAGLFGYILADGWVEKRRIGLVVNKDEVDIVSKIGLAFKNCFGAPITTYEHPTAGKEFNYKGFKFNYKGFNYKEVNYKEVNYYQVNRTHLAKLLSFLNEKRVPNYIFQSRDSVVASFLSWLYEGGGTVFSKWRGRTYTSGRTSVSLKSNSIELLRDVQLLLLRFGIRSRILWDEKTKAVGLKGREVKSRPSGTLMIRHSESIIKFAKNIGFVSKKKKEKLNQAVEYAKNHARTIRVSRAEKIVKINKLPLQDVFDIEVPKYHRFVANGIVVHNTAKSVLMKVVSTLIPRGRYVSGKGVTAAGLTATVVKDEEFLGGWVLEAGALVMCNRSLCAIDEFEKVEKTDQVALHEAMEQQSYHKDTKILFSNGEEMEIGKFVDDLIENNKERLVEGKDCQILDLRNENIRILTTDFEKIYETKATQVSRHKAPDELIKVTLSNGRIIKVTPEHPFWTIKGIDVVTVPARDLLEGQYVPAPRILPINGIDEELIFGNNLKEILTKNFPMHNDLRLDRFAGYLLTDGGYEINRRKKNGVNFTNKNDSLIKDFCSISNNLFGLKPYVYKKNGRATMARIISAPFVQYPSSIDPSLLESSEREVVPEILLRTSSENAEEMLKIMFECDGHVSNNRVGFVSSNRKMCEQIQTLLLRFGISSQIFEEILDSKKMFYRLTITGKENLTRFKNNIGFIYTRKNSKLKKQTNKRMYRTVKDIIPGVGKEVSTIAKKLKIRESKILGYSITHFKNEGNLSRRSLQKFVLKLQKKIEKLEYFKERIIKIKIDGINKLKRIRKTLSISQEDVAKTLCLRHQHISYWEKKRINSEIYRRGLLNFIKEALAYRHKVERLRKLAFGDITWNKIIKIERIECDDDWVYDIAVEPTKTFISECSVLHNSISIAKATIVATLPAQTAILAGGNPKLGRFDPYMPIKEQIDVPETLLSRFDLKFALRDVPNPELDTKVAEHILKSRHYGEEEDIPVIPSDILKKYIAYARKNSHPKLSREAGETIKEFFVDLRSKVAGEEAPVPITLRQYEALIRLAEASAKVQLRDTVTKEDALRAINLMKASLREFGFEPETGKLDIDRLEGRVTATDRGKIRVMLDVIEELTKALGKKMPKVEIIKLAKMRGLKDYDIEKMLNELKNTGDLFESSPGILEKI